VCIGVGANEGGSKIFSRNFFRVSSSARMALSNSPRLMVSDAAENNGETVSSTGTNGGIIEELI